MNRGYMYLSGERADSVDLGESSPCCARYGFPVIVLYTSATKIASLFVMPCIILSWIEAGVRVG